MALKNKFIIVFLLLFFSMASSVRAETVTLKQGEVLFYPIVSGNSKSSGENLSATFGGEKIPVFAYNAKNYALAAADVNKKVGVYNLRIFSGTKELEKKPIEVKKGKYPQVKTGVVYKFVTLPKNEQENVSKDKAELTTLLTKAVATPSPKLWQSMFRNPLDTITVTSPFGYKRIYTNYSTVHQGADLRAKIGTPVYAISDGKVVWGEGKTLYLEGPMVAIDHGNGIISKYLHLSKVLAQAGSMVKKGDIIGYSGDQGADVKGAHLHFAIKVGNASVNPLQFIREAQKLESK
jgi:murein DD-endopeptidase MepM/ murein hydrolase activator NlpD